jgi:hypothetical protein
MEIKVGDEIKYRGDHGIIYDGKVGRIDKMTRKGGVSFILENGIKLSILDIIKKVDDMDKRDMVNHPKHYTFGTIEVITVIEDWQLGFHEGNCIKYIARAKHKGHELEDFKKAQWYLNRKIEQLSKEK